MLRGENELLVIRDSDGFKGARFELCERFRAERREFERTANVRGVGTGQGVRDRDG